MATNFDYLLKRKGYEVFSQACVDAENILHYSPALSAVGSRKALELAVKWVFSADDTISMPYKSNLQALLHEPSFRFAVDSTTWGKLQYVVKIGNLGVHTEKAIQKSDAILALSVLFEFVEWLDYCYGETYSERKFDENLIPVHTADAGKLKAGLEQELNSFKNEAAKIISAKDKEIERLLSEVAKISEQYTANKDVHTEQRKFTSEDISEWETRKRYIDIDLKSAGWEFSQDKRISCVETEFPVVGMPKELGSGNGRVDYVLFGNDGTIIGLIEAKKTIKDPKVGSHQATLYADCIEKMKGHRPIIFTTNGFDTFIWDDQVSPQRNISSVFSQEDLQRLFNRRTSRKKLKEIAIDDKITDRYYQKEAIRAVCENIDSGHMKSLLVMATGTGKTRTSSSLTDVLSRGGYVTNILFLADRTALVSQAKDDFKNFLPDMSLCNLLSNKEEKNARIVFSTYPTMLNAIDGVRNEDGSRLFSPAHFDLIIIDEAHRSIFKKYKAIFEYFDAYLVGLTATPRQDVHSSTYEFFEVAKQVPTYAYEYDTAVEKDKVLVPFHNIETTTKFIEEGIFYDELKAEDKEKYEEEFVDDEGEIPDEIPSVQINQFIFNKDTVDKVINDLMNNGIREASGNRLGKTIIFAQNKKHAQFFVDRFDALYPEYKGGFCKRIVCGDSYAQDLIKRFKSPEKEPHIAVSVDMLDTGLDVPQVVNLVFFKKVRSKIKFWQMIGRGTRLCKNLLGEGQDKVCFYIFDYLGNFQYFRENENGIEPTGAMSTQAAIFTKRIRLISQLQAEAFIEEEYQNLRTELINTVFEQISSLNKERVDVQLKRRFVEKFSHRSAFEYISQIDKSELNNKIAELITTNDTDDAALDFDNLMYGIMLANLDGSRTFNRFKKQVQGKAGILLNKTTIPDVKKNVPVLKEVREEEFWEAADILNFERIRKELRSLMKFAKGEGADIHIVDFEDVWKDRIEGKDFIMHEDFEDYKLKVNRFIEENKHHIAIHKLRNNIPLSEGDYKALERIFTGELGTKEDYEYNFKDTPFGLLVRKVAKLERTAAMKAFSSFINEQNLDANQIAFVNKVIDYITENGYIESVIVLIRPPFDKPLPFVKLFDVNKQKQLAQIVNEVKENAVKIVV